MQEGGGKMFKNVCFTLIAVLVLIGFAGIAEAEVVAQPYSSNSQNWGGYQYPAYNDGMYGGGYYLCCFPLQQSYYPYQQYSQFQPQYTQYPSYGQYSYYGQQYPYYGQQYQQYPSSYASSPYYGQQQYYSPYCCYGPYPIYRAPY
jgi:hypothetical protein